MSNIILECRGVSHWFPANPGVSPVLHDVDMKVGNGQIVSLVGPQTRSLSNVILAQFQLWP